MRRTADPVRLAAFDALREVSGSGAYANLALARAIDKAGLAGQDAALATELVAGTSRLQGSLDQVIEAAGGRKLTSLQPAVVDALRLAAYQLLYLRTPRHAAVAATVDVAAVAIGERVAGVVNAISRKIASRTLDEWLDLLTEDRSELDALALLTGHPAWIVQAYADVLPSNEVSAALAANNVGPAPTLAVRPGLADVTELDGEPTRYSRFGATRAGNPADVGAVVEHRAGVEDEGSQLVAAALTAPEAPKGPWLDLCAGPGGKTALLRGLLPDDEWLLASERHPHRARLVEAALQAYPRHHQVVTCDGTAPAWQPGSFARVLVDAPCSGLGSLRRRAESRWRKQPSDVNELHDLQVALLTSAIEAAKPGGVVGYVTCSPLRHETAGVVAGVGDQVEVLDAPTALDSIARRPIPNAACDLDARFVQLWPHRHGTDAMFLALLRKPGR